MFYKYMNMYNTRTSCELIQHRHAIWRQRAAKLHPTNQTHFFSRETFYVRDISHLISRPLRDFTGRPWGEQNILRHY